MEVTQSVPCGKQVGINLQQNEMGKAVNQVLKTSADKDAEIIEENIEKASEKKEELERAEAQRIAKKQEAPGTPVQNSSSRGDTVEISDEGLEASKGVIIAVIPPKADPSATQTVSLDSEQQSVPLPPSSPTHGYGKSSGAEAPKSEPQQNETL